jgi:hypothetical protein
VSRPYPQTRRRRRVFILITILVIFLSALAAIFIFLRWHERPLPTVAGWRARVLIFAGDGAPGTRDDASGAQARFADPFGVAVDKEGNVFVADAGSSNRIRKITPQGAVSTFAGGAEGFADGKGSAAAFNTPSALALDRAGSTSPTRATTASVKSRPTALSRPSREMARLPIATGAARKPSSTRPSASQWTSTATSMWLTPTTTASESSRRTVM